MTKAIEVRVRRASRRLEVDFDTGERFSYPAEYLRVESPSAEVQGHSPAEKVLVAGKQDVGITSVEPIGHYAVRVLFDDKHDTGIYSWSYLLELGREQPSRWAAYLAALAEKGLTRGPAPRPQPR